MATVYKLVVKSRVPRVTRSCSLICVTNLLIPPLIPGTRCVYREKAQAALAMPI